MPFPFACPDCGAKHKVLDESAGRRHKCRECGATFRPLATETNAGASLSLSGNPSDSSTSLPPTIGRFQILAKLGAGAFGTVYRAHDPVLEREVALKVPNPGLLASEKDKQRYLREPKAAGQLHHPYIVPVFDASLDGDNIFIVSEYIAGITLEKAIKTKRPGFRDAAMLVLKLAQALQYAHDHGVVHRDVKPANIMLNLKREPLLMDFGLARLQESAEKLTMNAAILGTPAYMSPEQAACKHDQVGPASDQYSLGVILYELLCGQRPFSGPPAMVMSLVIQQDPRSPRTVNPKIPIDLETIALKAMEKEPGKRFADCQSLADDLDRWSRDEPITARRMTALERGLRWFRRNPLVAGLTLAVVMVSLIGFLVSSSALGYSWVKEQQARVAANLAAEKAEEAIAQQKRADEKAEEAVKQTEIARQERDRSKAESRRAYQNDYIGQMNLVQRDWDEVDLRQLRLRLTRTHPENTGGDDFRGFEWYYWNRLSHSARIRMKVKGGFSSCACTEDRQRIVTVGVLTIIVWDVASGRELKRFPNPSDPGEVSLPFGAAISPDDRRIVLGYSGGLIRIVDLESGRVELVIKGHDDIVSNVVYSPDGRQIASASYDKTAKIWDASTGREVFSINGHNDSVLGVAFSPDGNRIATTGFDRTARVWNAANGTEILVLKGHSRHIGEVAFSKDGKLIATGSEDGSVKIWNASNGAEVWTLKGHDRPIRSIAFRPDGKELASGSDDTTVRTWDLALGKETVRLKDHEGRVIHVSYSLDGANLVSAGNDGDRGIRDGAINVWGPVVHQENSIVTRQEFVPSTVSFSPDGRLIACNDGAIVNVFDVAGLRRQFSLVGHTDNITCIRFSPSGKVVASASADKSIRLCSVETGREVAKLTGSKAKVDCVAFSPDGTRLVAACGREIKVWDTTTGEEVLRKVCETNYINKNHEEPIHSVAFSPSGSQILFTSQFQLRVFDSTTGKYTTSDKKIGSGRYIWISGDGRLLYSAGGLDGVQIIDFVTLKNVAQVGKSVGWDVSVAAFSPDGRRLACMPDPKRIRLFDISTGQQTLELRGHNDWVTCIAFSPDGSRLVSGSADKTVRVWETSGVE